MLTPVRTYGRVEERLTSLFLSATVRDMGDYRAKIPEWARHLNINVNPQKYWSGAAEPIEELCTRRISGCSGYIGVFGYRYGWQPPGQERSITHIEFDHAMSIWKDRSKFPPVFLFLPRTGSVASRHLRKLADEVLAKEFGNERAQIKNSRTKQEGLRQTIASLGRLVNDFTSIGELKERVTASFFHYHTTLLEGLGQAEPLGAKASGIPSAQLGRIGRDKQIEAIKSILFALAAQPTAPGACLIVHGREGSGLAEFLDFLGSWRGWGSTARVRTISPSEEDPAYLAAWMRRAFGETGTAEGDPFEILADGITRRCEREYPVVIIKQRRGWRPEKFQAQFWQPLYERLLARWSAPESRKRFVLVRVFANPIGPDEAQLMHAGEPREAKIDWTHPQLLPPCTDLTEAQVASWLMSDDLGLDPHRAVRVAREVVRQSDGTVDGTPLHVFDRLRADGFWEELTARAVP
jgi:hypothetical protein